MSTELIAWVDVETTGLHPTKGDQLLEVACFVTDYNLNLLDEVGYHAVVGYTPEQITEMLDQCDPYVRQMHNRTGLWSKLTTGIPVTSIDEQLLSYVGQFAPERRTIRLGGNSVRLDLNFIDEYLPKFADHLHYRSVDVTAVSKLAEEWFGYKQRKTVSLHEARADILASLNQLRDLRNVLSFDSPAPTK